MNTIVKAAAVQISPVLYSRQGTVEKVVKKIGELGEQGVRFATFPETFAQKVLSPTRQGFGGHNEAKSHGSNRMEDKA